MKRSLIVVATLVLIVSLSGCKSSGVAVTGKGEILRIDIDAPGDLPDGDTEELTVRLANRGVSTVQDVVFEVQLPEELVVLSSVPGQGIRESEKVGERGEKIFTYNADDIEPLHDSVVRYHVRASFGGRETTGDIKVTAWAESLPGNRLIETKQVRLRR